MYTGDMMPVGDKSIPIKFFLILPILFASFCLENLTVALFGPLLGNQWQSSMLEESISTSSFLNNWRAVSSSFEFSIDSRKTLSSKHFCLEYWQLVTPAFQQNNLLPQFWAGLSGDAKFWLHFLIIVPEVRCFFIYVCQGWIEPVWYSRTKAITSSLGSFSSTDSDNDIVI